MQPATAKITDALTEGDIFSWCYTDDERQRRAQHTSDVYWCKSRMAVVRRGMLVDTYWSSPDCALDQAGIVLTFLGNPTSMMKINEWERAFYRPEDLVDMRHANNSGAPVYVKAGASRNPEVMREYYAYKIERFTSDIRFAQDNIEDCKKALASIERGELDGNGFRTWSDRR